MAASGGAERVHTYLVLKERGQPDRVLVWDVQEISVGRASDNDLKVEHAEVSRRHAHFSRNDGRYSVANMSTSNGTLVNGTPVKTQVLETRDVVQIPQLELTFFQSPKNPASLGLKLEYASQLKDFGGPSANASPDATILGMGEVPADEAGADDEEFQVRPAGDFAYDLYELGDAPASASSARDLDLELEDLGTEELELPQADALELPQAQELVLPDDAPPAPRRAAPRPTPAPQPRAPAADDSWTLEDEPPAELAEAPSRVSLHLEIEGLTAEQRVTLESLLGKVIELPALRIRVKGDDLG